jgi:aminoglycoside 3-N-acetyltransferase
MNSDAVSSDRPTISRERLVSDLEKLGVQRGDLLNIKVSLKSIGHVEGGPKTVIDALMDVVGPEGTVVTESFVSAYPLPMSKRNATKISDRWTPSYAGAVANAMIRYPNSYRSLHPIQKFSAVGALAEELTQSHTAVSYAYDVLRKMCEMRGHNLKIGRDDKVPGVGTTHVAIGYHLGLTQDWPPFGVNYLNEDGEVVTFERNWAGGCGFGFNKFIPLYRDAGAILGEGQIGNAESKITDMKRTLEVEIDKLSKDPAFFLCDNPLCESCRLSWDFSDGSRWILAYRRLMISPRAFFRRVLRKLAR